MERLISVAESTCHDMNILTAIGVEGANSLLAIKWCCWRSSLFIYSFALVIVVLSSMSWWPFSYRSATALQPLLSWEKACNTHLTQWHFAILTIFQVIFKNFFASASSQYQGCVHTLTHLHIESNAYFMWLQACRPFFHILNWFFFW